MLSFSLTQHSFSCSLSFSLALSVCLSLRLCFALTDYFASNSLPLSLSLTYLQAHLHSLCHTLILVYSLSISPSFTCTWLHTVFLSLTLSFSLSISHTHTHTHSHTHPLALTVNLGQPLSLSHKQLDKKQWRPFNISRSQGKYPSSSSHYFGARKPKNNDSGLKSFTDPLLLVAVSRNW